MIEFIKNDCKGQGNYHLWPKNNDDEFNDYLLQGFYNKIIELNCLKTKYKGKEEWSRPSKEIFILQELDKNLFTSFQNHFPVITPKPPKYIVEGVKLGNVDLGKITPEFIREYLEEQSEDIEFPVPMKESPIIILSKKEWLLSIIEYCAEANDYSYLSGLPLQLDIDHKLHQVKENCLLDSDPNLKIFQGDTELFVESEIVEQIRSAEELPETWLEPTLKNYLFLLLEHIERIDRKRKDWLGPLVNMIVEAGESEVADALGEIHELEIVYQKNGSFVKLKSDNDSPVLIQESELSDIKYLVKSGMKLVHPDYIDIYKPLLKWNKFQLISKLNSHTLIKHLVSLSVDECEFFKEKNTREYLVDLLAQDISWIEKLSESEKEWLDDMPFIATGGVSGKVYAKSDDKRLFLPAGFNPPQHIKNLNGKYDIIYVVDEKQHEMYKQLGFEEQNSVNYLKEIILPFFIGTKPSVDDVISILEWLANNWTELIKGLEKYKKEGLIASFSEADIVLDNDNNLKSAQEYYLFDFFSKLPEFLQNKKYFPLVFEDDETQKNWSKLLSILGAKNSVIPEHVVSTIQSISDDIDNNRAIELLNYLSNHFELFEKMEYDGENIFEYVSNLAWIPAEKPENEFLIPQHEFEYLQKPFELILPNNFMIAGGAHFSLNCKVKLGKKDIHSEYSEKQIAKSLGIKVKLPNESIFTSFRQLMKINTINEQVKSKVLNFAKATYKYIGRSSIEDRDIPEDIKSSSIFLKGHWTNSNKVFQIPVILTNVFSWDELVNNGNENLKDGLIKLGVQEKPDTDWLVNFLENLPQHEKLEGQKLKDAKGILNLLSDRIDELGFLSSIPVLTKNNELVPSDEVFIDDLPAYKNAIDKNENIPRCQNQFNSIAKQNDATSIAKNIYSQINDTESKYLENDNVDDDLRLDHYIKQDSFKSAVLRLAYHEDKITDDKIDQSLLDEILPSDIQFMERLSVRYDIDDIWIYTDSTATTFEDDTTLYLLLQDDTEDMCESIGKYICEKSSLSSDSREWIGRILRNQLSLKDTQGVIPPFITEVKSRRLHLFQLVSWWHTANR